MISSRFLAQVAVAFFLAHTASAETHVIKFVNKCGYGSPELIYDGKNILTGDSYTSNGPYSGIAYLQTGGCNTNGEGCTLLETTLNNPTCPGCGSSTDISLISPHKFNVETSFAYYNGCDGQGQTCTNPSCTNAAFFAPNDNFVQVACQVDNVNLLVAFCANASELVTGNGAGGSSPMTSMLPGTPSMGPSSHRSMSSTKSMPSSTHSMGPSSHRSMSSTKSMPSSTHSMESANHRSMPPTTTMHTRIETPTNLSDLDCGDESGTTTPSVSMPTQTPTPGGTDTSGGETTTPSSMPMSTPTTTGPDTTDPCGDEPPETTPSTMHTAPPNPPMQSPTQSPTDGSDPCDEPGETTPSSVPTPPPSTPTQTPAQTPPDSNQLGEVPQPSSPTTPTQVPAQMPTDGSDPCDEPGETTPSSMPPSPATMPMGTPTDGSDPCDEPTTMASPTVTPMPTPSMSSQSSSPTFTPSRRHCRPRPTGPSVSGSAPTNPADTPMPTTPMTTPVTTPVTTPSAGTGTSDTSTPTVATPTPYRVRRHYRNRIRY